MPITIEELSDLLLQVGLKDQNTRQEILREAKELENQKKEDKEADKNNPKKKKKLNIVIRTDDPNVCANIVAEWVIESPEDVPVEQLENRMVVSAARQNENCKKKCKIFTWPNFFQYIKPKFVKEEDCLVRVKTKEAVQIIWLDKNEIPFR
jgi:hypothetical protein